jgi:hypothetical protein
MIYDRTTNNTANKGFSAMRRFVARFNVSCILIRKKPAIPYCPILSNVVRYANDLCNFKIY